MVPKLIKFLYVQVEASHRCYQELKNIIEEISFKKSDSDIHPFHSKKTIYVACVDNCIFWDISQADIEEFLKSFEDYGPKHHW